MLIMLAAGSPKLLELQKMTMACWDTYFFKLRFGGLLPPSPREQLIEYGGKTVQMQIMKDTDDYNIYIKF